MKRVHIISVGDPRLCQLAIAMKRKGYQVTGSGVGIMNPMSGKLKEFDLLPAQEGWFPEQLSKEYDFVIPANDVLITNPELLRARELNLMILSYPEFIFSRIKGKSRLMVSGGKAQKQTILHMIMYAMKKNSLLFDPIIFEEIEGNLHLSWSYDARLALLEDYEHTFSPFIKKQINEYYRPHILVLPEIIWEPSETFQTFDQYLDSLKRLIASIERDGKLIYNENNAVLCELATLVREDITAMPYKVHPMREDENGVYLVSRFGEYKINRKENLFLETLNAARIACRQMGLQDKDFYEAISEYSSNFSTLC